MSDNAPSAAPARETKRGHGVDLDKMTVQELTALITAAEAKRREKQEEGKATLLAKWKAEAAEAGLTLDAVLPGITSSAGQGRKARKDTGDKLPVKYRGPNGEEWSGRGRLPKWLQTLEAEGKNREAFKA